MIYLLLWFAYFGIMERALGVLFWSVQITRYWVLAKVSLLSGYWKLKNVKWGFAMFAQNTENWNNMPCSSSSHDLVKGSICLRKTRSFICWLEYQSTVVWGMIYLKSSTSVCSVCLYMLFFFDKTRVCSMCVLTLFIFGLYMRMFSVYDNTFLSYIRLWLWWFNLLLSLCLCFSCNYYD